MKEFIVLFKHELKTLFPILTFNRNKKHDWFGTILSIVLTVFVLGVFIQLVYTIVNGYVDVKLNKLSNPNARATELLNTLYIFVSVLMVIACIKKMSNVLTDKKNRQVYLRLPIKESELLLSKLLALLVWTIVTGMICILPINIIFSMALDVSFGFWLKTIFVILIIPIVVFGISILLLVPVIKIADKLKDKYWVLFVLISGLLIVAFMVYSKFLEIIQLWLETGSIKFLFNNQFIATLQKLLKVSYPLNSFANIMFGNRIGVSIIVVILSIGLSLLLAFLVSRRLFYLTLYQTDENQKIRQKNKFTQNKPIISLIKKEFICIYRSPKHLFAYFSIALAMPVMVYCCYTLFESLIVNAFGLKITFSLALLVLLIFSILTNTFCATNISREGVSFLKMKSLAIKPSHLLLAKVLFCSAVSTLSILASVVLLIVTTSFAFGEGLLCLLIVTLFSIAQILIATRMDLNNAKLSSTSIEAEVTTSKTIIKVVGLGLVLAVVIGIASMVIYILAQGSIIATNLNLKQIYAYIWPCLIGVIYFVIAIVYYNRKIDTSFEKLDR